MINKTENIVLFVFFIVSFLFGFSSLFGQTSLFVMQGDTIEFHATQVTTLEDGAPIPDGDIILYHIHIIYKDGTEEQLIHNDPMEFPDGSNIIVLADATTKVGTHKIEAWSVRIKPNGSGGENNIAAEKAILLLTVEQSVDNRAPAKWIITIHRKEN